MFVRTLERFSSALQLVVVLIGGLWFCYRGSTFSDPTGHNTVLPAVMAILTGMAVVSVVIYVATVTYLKNREQA